MGNCAGCTGPQRTYRVQRLQQNSPIKNRLSQGTKYYPQSNSLINELTFNQKDKLHDRSPFSETDLFGNIVGLSQSKSRPIVGYNELYNSLQTNNMYAQGNNLYTNNGIQAQNNNNGDFPRDLLSQIVKTHIKLYPDNPENHRQTSPQLDKSYLYQKQQDLRNSKLDPSRKLSSPESYSKQLLKSVQSESKRYLRDVASEQKSPSQNRENSSHRSELKPNYIVQPFPSNTSYSEQLLPRFDEISEIRTEKKSKANYEDENSLPLKKYSKFNRGLTVIEEILQQDHKTPHDIRLERKNNGEDVIFDVFEGFPEQLEPLELPNLSPYFSVLRAIQQKG